MARNEIYRQAAAELLDELIRGGRTQPPPPKPQQVQITDLLPWLRPTQGQVTDQHDWLRPTTQGLVTDQGGWLRPTTGPFITRLPSIMDFLGQFNPRTSIAPQQGYTSDTPPRPQEGYPSPDPRPPQEGFTPLDPLTKGLAYAAARGQPPWELTREEFEQTAETFLHGTSRLFEQFAQEGEPYKDRYGKETMAGAYRRPVGTEPNPGRFYFTEDPLVAGTFSSTGSAEASVHNVPRGLLEEDWQSGDVREAVEERVERGWKLQYMDEDGKWQDAKSVSEVDEQDPLVFDDGIVRVYPPTREPRIIETKVFGSTLDLRDPQNIPEELNRLLKREGRFTPDDPYMLPGWDHEYSKVLIDYAREKGYGKIRVKDGYQSGFESIIGLSEYIGLNRDPHREIVRKAVSEGKPVPERVLQDYPVAAAQAAEIGIDPQYLPQSPPRRPPSDVSNLFPRHLTGRGGGGVGI